MKTLKNISLRTAAFLIALMVSSPALVLGQSAKTIEIKGTDQMKFSKTELTAKPGQKITVKLTTVSNLPPQAMSHDFVLLTVNADASKVAQACISHPDNGYIDPKMKDQIIAHTDMAGGGETVEVTFTAPTKPGEYTYICTFPGHFASGMKGKLTVQ